MSPPGRPGKGAFLAEIGFYHLLSTPLERALPRLLERALREGHRVVLRGASPERIEYLNALLWTYDDAGFLPHGSARDGNPAAQPVFLTEREENPNGATMLVLVDGVAAGDLALFVRCADLFDGNDENAVAAARQRWRQARDAGHKLSYWRQTTSGWERDG
jgi:DNA polymerase-3 subunit chi